MLDIAVANEQSNLAIDAERIRRAVELVIQSETERAAAVISVAVVDDEAIHRLNREYLGHDYATDVLSFPLSDADDRLEGEIVASADTALRESAAYEWPADDELLLYVIHGALHLVGYSDKSPADAATMRAREARYLAEFGLTPLGDPGHVRSAVACSGELDR